jgi:hypothetical protein
MKNIGVFLLLGLLSTGSLCGQPHKEGTAKASSFLLDSSKPYVYLEVDHVGQREPLLQGEPTVGLWLRLKNNCALPVVIVMLKGSLEKLNPSVMDEVVPNPPQAKGDTTGSGIIYKVEQEGLTDVFVTPNQDEAEVRGAEGGSNSVPRGYNGGQEPGVPVLTVVPPGGEISFSVPNNHVGKTWHFEVPFRFALKREGPIRQPYSYVAFFWEDLPEKYRTVVIESPRSKPASPGSTLLHEPGHVDPPKPQ